METNLVKKFIQKNITRLKEYEEMGEPLSNYELGKLNAYDSILMLIDTLDDEKNRPS